MTSRSNHRFALRTIASLLAAMYGVLASVGDGLHALSHDAVCSAGDCASASCHSSAVEPPACGCCDHPPQPVEAAACYRTAGQAPDLGVPTDGKPPHDHDCPVCQLLALVAQSAAAASPELWVENALDRTASLEERLLPTRWVRLFDARGPPATA